VGGTGVGVTGGNVGGGGGSVGGGGGNVGVGNGVAFTSGGAGTASLENSRRRVIGPAMPSSTRLW